MHDNKITESQVDAQIISPTTGINTFKKRGKM